MTKLLTEPQKLLVAQMALEQIKDAPLLAEEIDDIARDALHIMFWGDRHRGVLSPWGVRVLKTISKE